MLAAKPRPLGHAIHPDPSGPPAHFSCPAPVCSEHCHATRWTTLLSTTTTVHCPLAISPESLHSPQCAGQRQASGAEIGADRRSAKLRRRAHFRPSLANHTPASPRDSQSTSRAAPYTSPHLVLPLAARAPSDRFHLPSRRRRRRLLLPSRATSNSAPRYQLPSPAGTPAPTRTSKVHEAAPPRALSRCHCH